ncbi:MAG: hypothetical protein OXH09_03625 [Gammaproteobacteria bacterium]|nr:hypothetical protein [Gammaproteobacteria bacterium]
MKTRPHWATDKEQADQLIEPMMGVSNPLSASRLTVPHLGSDRAESTTRELLALLCDMFSPPMTPEDESAQTDPWLDYLVDYAQVNADVRTCYVTWKGLLRAEQPDREAEATARHDMVQSLVLAREEIMGVLERDVKRQTHVIWDLLRAKRLDRDDVPAEQAVGS